MRKQDGVKICSCCNAEKSVDEFHSRKLSCDGLAAQCKDCVREYQQAYLEAKGDELSLKRKPYLRAYYESNKHRWKAYSHTRRSAIRGETFSIDDVAKKISMQRGRCAACGMKLLGEYHIDHIVPLSKGGRNVSNNIQVMHPRCNLKKGSKDPIEWARRRGLLI